ncbi:sugar transporter family protein [Corynebacterium pilosum]|uniref:Sugar transporter family protein n=2 Tax=Corynebacterium pilosum TaxID=35756 RepID=A0A376CL06_9CORY|nr:sugar transporter family protein [Corynebacterium pilosum]
MHGVPQKFPYLPLSAMSFAAFIYVTFEMFAVGLITPMSRDLGVTEGQIGLLMTVYAGIVAVVTLPLMYFTRNLNRKPLFMSTLLFLILGIVLQGIATNYWVLVAGRVAAALTHGLFWSAVNPMAARLAPAGHAGRAIGVVSIGSTMALVVGSPLATFFGTWLGWRTATWLLGGLVVLAFIALFFSLPTMPARTPPPATEQVRQRSALPSLIVYLLLAVTAAFSAYTYLGLIVEVTSGPELVAIGLAAFGGFGVVGVLLATRMVDTRMIRLNTLTAGSMVLAAVLGLLGFASTGTTTVALIFLMIAIFGTGYGALPTVATTIFLHAGKENQDRASSIYVVTYQVGIASGSALGSVAVDGGFLPGTVVLLGVLATAAGLTLALWSRPLLR